MGIRRLEAGEIRDLTEGDGSLPADRPSASAPRRKTAAWIVAAILGILAVAGFICSRGLPGQPEALSGEFEQEIVRVTPVTGGRVLAVNVREGDTVQPGTVLLRLDDGGLRARYEQARSLLTRAASQIEAASFLGTLSPEAIRQLLDRNPEVQSAEGAYVQAVADQKQAGPEDAEARRKLNQAGQYRDEIRAKVSRQWRAAFGQGDDLVLQLKEQIKTMEDQLASLQVTAPCAGAVEIFQMQPGDLVIPGQPVAEIARAGSYYVDAYASSDQLGPLREGTPVHVQVGGGHPIAGKIQHVARTPADFGLTPSTNTDRLYRVHVTVDEPQPGASAGMPATVWLGPNRG